MKNLWKKIQENKLVIVLVSIVTIFLAIFLRRPKSKLDSLVEAEKKVAEKKVTEIREEETIINESIDNLSPPKIVVPKTLEEMRKEYDKL